MADSQVRGTLPEVIRNEQRRYEGDLAHYFRVVFQHAQNLRQPYHNFRHMTHVLWLCHDACGFYAKELTPRQMRTLLIAALFHDFDHSGLFGNDDLNIERAVRGLKKHLLPRDVGEFAAMETLIRATQYPPTISGEDLSLAAQILCDADVSQAFSAAWIQQVIFGLSGEWGNTPLDALRAQEPFLRKLKFHTKWARGRFSLFDIEAKIKEVQELCEILGTKSFESL